MEDEIMPGDENIDEINPEEYPEELPDSGVKRGSILDDGDVTEAGDINEADLEVEEKD